MIIGNELKKNLNILDGVIINILIEIIIKEL
jgi:hypothetical protein